MYASSFSASWHIRLLYVSVCMADFVKEICFTSERLLSYLNYNYRKWTALNIRSISLASSLILNKYPTSLSKSMHPQHMAAHLFLPTLNYLALFLATHRSVWDIFTFSHFQLVKTTDLRVAGSRQPTSASHQLSTNLGNPSAIIWWQFSLGGNSQCLWAPGAARGYLENR